MVFARIGHGSCYYHWNEIFAGVQYHPLAKPPAEPPDDPQPPQQKYIDKEQSVHYSLTRQISTLVSNFWENNYKRQLFYQ